MISAVAALHIGRGRMSTGHTPMADLKSGAQSRRFRAEADVAFRVRSSLRGGDDVGAARAALEAHGAEVFGFLLGVSDDAVAAEAMYADLGRRVKTELSEFDWEWSLRIWLYTLARRELADRRHRRRQMTTATEPADSEPSVRGSHQRLRAPRVVSRIRRALTEEEREVLILCVDRKLGWRELARTALGSRADAGQVDAEAERVREVVSALRARLETEAIRERLLPPRTVR